MKRAGFSLLEVILAMAILAGAIAILGESSRQALRNATVAKDMARAQLLCETKLAEIAAGITPLEPIEGAAFDTITEPGEPAWLYSIETDPTDEDGLISVRLTVTRDLPPEERPIRFSVVRWFSDPSASSNQNTASETGNGT